MSSPSSWFMRGTDMGTRYASHRPVLDGMWWKTASVQPERPVASPWTKRQILGLFITLLTTPVGDSFK